MQLFHTIGFLFIFCSYLLLLYLYVLVYIWQNSVDIKSVQLSCCKMSLILHLANKTLKLTLFTILEKRRSFVSDMANISEELENESKSEKPLEKQPRRRSICISSLWCLNAEKKGRVSGKYFFAYFMTLGLYQFYKLSF